MDTMLRAARDTFVFAFDALYPRRDEPRVRLILDRIQDRIDEITAHFGDEAIWTFGSKNPPPYVANPGAHEPR